MSVDFLVAFTIISMVTYTMLGGFAVMFLAALFLTPEDPYLRYERWEPPLWLRFVAGVPVVFSAAVLVLYGGISLFRLLDKLVTASM